MKKIANRILAVLMALFISLSGVLSGAVFAADETGSITINNAQKGQTYTIYKILNLESYDKDNNLYSYTVTDEWKDFISGLSDAEDYVRLSNDGYVEWIGNNSDDPVAFVEMAVKYAIDNNITKTAAKTTRDGETTVKFTGLTLGYYAIDSTTGTVCALTTTNPDVTVNEKNNAPTIDKKVETASGSNTYAAENSASVGDTVNYEITVKAHAGAENYVIHDTMTDGLTFKASSVSVTYKTRNASSYTTVPSTAYKVNTENDDGCDFEISFGKTFLDGITTETDIVVKYSATINENAVTKTDGSNKNTATLKYGNNSDLETTPSSTDTYTYRFGLVKTNTTNTVITGAEFKLYKTVNGAEVEVPMILDAVKNVYRPALAGETATVIAAGNVVLSGLEGREYILRETKAPTGYNKLDGGVTVNLTADNDAVVNDTVYENGGVQIINKAGNLMPSTGGIGTTIFYVAGISLIVIAGIAVIIRRHR